MKIAALLILSAAFLQAQNVEWQTRIIQTQLGGAVGTPQLVDDNGSKPSLPIGANGSRFELWTWRFLDGEFISEELLDTTEVGTYLPTAEITINTADPFEGFHRSRVDQPFTVTFDADNLRANSEGGAPISSRRVLVEHHVDLFTDGNFDGTSIESTELVRSFFLNDNDPLVVNYAVTNITAPDIARRAGRERFIIYALEDGDTPQRVIASDEVLILPLSEAFITILSEKEIYKTLPDFDSTIHRAYPGSSTWVEVYDGQFSGSKRGFRLNTTFEATGHDYTADPKVIQLRDFPIEVQPALAGFKTIVLRSSSPFGGESIEAGGIVLAHETVRVGNVMRINAMVTDMETVATP